MTDRTGCRFFLNNKKFKKNKKKKEIIMIVYKRSLYGWRLLCQIHGSAVYRSVLPSFCSVALYFLCRRFQIEGAGIGSDDVLHPYALGVLVASSTFLIVFKLNHSYGRYWEACGSTLQFISKWLDATTHTSCYHMQCDHYNKIKPPSFYDYPELNHLCMTRDRESSTLDITNNNVGIHNETENSTSAFDDELNFGKQTLPPMLRDNNSIHGDFEDPSREASMLSVTDRIESKSYARYASEEPGNNSVSEVEGSIRSNSEYAASRLSTSPNARAGKVNQKTHQERRKEAHKRRSSLKSINYIHENVAHEDSHESVCPIKSLYDVTSIRKSGHIGMDQVNSYYEEGIFHSTGRSEPIPLVGKPILDGGWGKYYTNYQKHPLSTFFDPLHPDNIDPKGFASIQGGRTPPLFLQELAHLSSLLNAVALSTLRNDVEGCESPLAIYEPGNKFPDVDPNKDEWLEQKGWKAIFSLIKSFFGVRMTEAQRSKHNAALPLAVIGGVSDAEIRFLQIAKGPSAKTQLCFNWLTEFIIREHLAGTLGTVGPPIISRIVQFLGDGMIYYNHARKIMFIPFPFVHAQLSVVFVDVMLFVIPFLMHQYTDEPWVGSILTFFTVLCLFGINEVARDLECPFRNYPNELPVTNFQAQYNEALITMFAGYHPDLYWEGDQVMRMANIVPKTQEDYHGKPTPKPAVTHRKSLNNSPETTEIAELKRQLEEQSKLIEKLVAKMGPLEEDK